MLMVENDSTDHGPPAIPVQGMPKTSVDRYFLRYLGEAEKMKCIYYRGHSPKNTTAPVTGVSHCNIRAKR